MSRAKTDKWILKQVQDDEEGNDETNLTKNSGDLGINPENQRISNLAHIDRRPRNAWSRG